MEPFPKRQKLHAASSRLFSQSFDDQYAYYDELGDDMVEEEEEYNNEDEEATPDARYDPEADLHQKRARLDEKLKSTFESIFEKYERNFDGVGDEIDMETGEIVVNNGHLMQMMGEQDAGEEYVARHAMRDYTEEPGHFPSSSFGEMEMVNSEDDDEDDEYGTSEDILDDMEEDDMILRGFVKANRFQQASLELGMSNTPLSRPKVRRQNVIPRPAVNKQLPSRADIMAQFGPQLGPQIVEYVSKQHVQEDGHVEPSFRASDRLEKAPVERKIEPTWRVPALSSAGPSKQVESVWHVPDLPSSAPIRRPAKYPTVIAPEESRSPSPEASRSIWAPTRTRVRRRRDADNNSLSREDSVTLGHTYTPLLHPQQNSISFGEVGFSSPEKNWPAFTAEEDDMMLHWVSKTQKQGFPLTIGRWREFQAEHPQHSAGSWRQRYTTKYTYLATKQVGDSVISNPEASAENMGHQSLPSISRTEPKYGVGPAPRQHPARVRKPAQTDPRILNWSEAVDSIEALDPILHAGILEDVRNANGNERFVQSTSIGQDARRVQDKSDTHAPSQEITPLQDDSHFFADAQNPSSLAVVSTLDQEDALIPCAPCPHADCRLLPTILYKLQRRENEEVSEICLHLFRVHHTTPFPCGEIGCPKTGEDGFFLQLDLIKHVRLRHKSVSSLQRLRGRVDPTLLEQQMKLASNHQDDSLPGMRANQYRDSDFMSTRNQDTQNISSSQAPSGFDPDRTVTPRGVAGRSTFTPRTSVSSLKVHHPSATSKLVREDSNLQDREILDSQADNSFRDERSSPPIIDEEPSRRRAGDSFQRPIHVLPGESPGMRTEADLSTGNIDFQRPRTSGSSVAHSHCFPRPRRTSLVNLPDVRVRGKGDLVASPPMLKSLAKASASSLSTNGHLQASTEEAFTPFASSTIKVVAKQSPVVETLTRNRVDAAYDFSDEEMAAPTPETVPLIPPVAKPMPKHLIEARAAASILNVSVGIKPGVKPLGNLPIATPESSTSIKRRVETGMKIKKAKPPLATPAAKILYRRAHSEGIDELSMGVEDFIMLSAQARTNPLPNLQMGIKHEEAADLTWRSVPAARKRKLDAFQGHETGCLGTADASGDISSTKRASSPSITQPMIKTESDGVPLPVVHPTLSKRRGRPPKPKITSLAVSPSSQTPPMPNLSLPVPIRTSTPLLDLTPVRNRRANAERIKEIADSDVEASPDCDSPSERLKHLPQVGGGNWNKNSLRAEGVAVLVKTPGGTMRRCGVEGFECGRSFCFRCSKETDEDQASKFRVA
ncbi:unnamed protein product [Diplocarpon coronariae]|uniref:TERF2-interacting telomeric protein 1 Myb domain-containing protein n=1 Tax=Diplocarpon coronariae TaxID=2795749 RepID=A0A218YY07_9HELO|nr:hypothetical protein B2J93_3796 [Marssonina coronariae]